MKQRLFWSIVALCWLPSVRALAQLQLSFPQSRAVYQRNTANNAVVNISGTYTTAVTRIDARVVARNNQGFSTDWQPIVANPQGGVFSGQLTVQGGWYDLDVRLMRDGQEIATRRVERVGVGEVFIIAGQSNAGNIRGTDGSTLGDSAGDDRVNCVNYYYSPDYPNEPPAPTFSHLDNPNFIAPRGIGAWCWGRLGDLLANRLNVPILFFNAAFEGTLARNWAETATGQQSLSSYVPIYYPTKHPYYPLQLALQYYANTQGVRAILWHQGEGDNRFDTPTAQYVSYMQTVINQSRSDFGRNVAWVIARASYGDVLGTDAKVIAGQDQLIAGGNNVYAGPNTDVIQVPRSRPPLYDDIHFDNDGLREVANAWNASLTDGFFNSAAPIGPAPAPTIAVSCPGGNNVAYTVTNYDNVTWDSGETGRTITRGGGATVRAKARDSRGNLVFTPAITVSNAPTVQSESGINAFCEGNSVVLTSNYGENNVWSNGATTQRIIVNTTGSYSLRYNDVSGCTFTSNTLTITANPNPPAPTITNERPTTLCQGDNTVLVSSGSSRYNWSDGQTTQRATITQSGSYSLTVTDANGCTSPPSPVVTVTVNPVPATPQLTLSGRTTFCANESATLTSTEGLGYQWSSGQTSRSVSVNQSGTYQVRTRNQFNCLSAPSNSVSLVVNPLPAQPTITNERPTTFCQGESTVLIANAGGNRFNWSNGQTEQRITVTQSGSYSLTVSDANGCTSPASAVVNVVANPVPATPQLTANGRTTFCANESVTLTATEEAAYQWNSGQTSRSINVNQAGTYQVRTRNQFNCTSAPSNSVTITINPLPGAPTISARGALTFCQGNQLVLQTDSPLRSLWSTGDSSQTLGVIETGTYTARVRDANGCVSFNSNSLAVQVLARPQTPVIRQVGTYLLEASGAPAGEPYFWRLGTDSLTVTGSLLRVNQSGQYVVRTQQTYGPTLVCVSLPSAPFAYALPTDIQDVSVYPNPSPDGLFLLETLANLNNAVVRVYTLSGQLVLRSSVLVLDQRRQLNLQSLSPGPYIVNLEADGVRVSKRIQIGR